MPTTVHLSEYQRSQLEIVSTTVTSELQKVLIHYKSSRTMEQVTGWCCQRSECTVIWESSWQTLGMPGIFVRLQGSSSLKLVFSASHLQPRSGYIGLEAFVQKPSCVFLCVWLKVIRSLTQSHSQCVRLSNNFRWQAHILPVKCSAIKLCKVK